MQHLNQFDPPVFAVCVFLCMPSIYTDFFRSWCVCNLSSEKIAVILKIEVLFYYYILKCINSYIDINCKFCVSFLHSFKALATITMIFFAGQSRHLQVKHSKKNST